MILPPFELHAAASIAEATELLERFGEDAAVYCGGTELLLLLKLGFADFDHLVDIKGIPELGVLEARDGMLHAGASVTHRRLERSPVVREGWPELAAMERGVANVRVRNAGTLGGNLCFADPHSDPATFLLAAEADVVLRRGQGEERVLPLADFVVGPYETVLRPGELLASIRIPETPPGSAFAHRRLAFHERPAATITCFARLESGRVAEARVAVGSVGAVPARVPAAESRLTGEPGDDAIAEAGRIAAQAATPVADANGSVEYKRNLVQVLVGRAFREALAAAA